MRKLMLAAIVLLVLVGAGSTSAQSDQSKMFGVFETSRPDLVVKDGFDVVERDLWVTAGDRHYSDLPDTTRQPFETYMTYAQDHGLKVVLNIWQVGWPIKGRQYAPPTRPHQWRGMCDVAKDVVTAYPAIIGLVVGAEPNSRHFWAGQSTAPAAYTAWLATCYDKIKQVRPDVDVYGGSLASRAGPGGTSPQDFIVGMCRAYQKNGRSGPIMDGFDMHWYSQDAPDTKHSNSISLGDYDQLESLLSCFGTGPMPILWGEGGYETQIPKQESDRYKGPAPRKYVVDPETQAAWYAQAVQMVACQPNAVGLFIFHMVDDPQLDQWQSGLYYANAKRNLQAAGGYKDLPKQSLSAVEQAVQSAQDGQTQCR